MTEAMSRSMVDRPRLLVADADAAFARRVAHAFETQQPGFAAVVATSLAEAQNRLSGHAFSAAVVGLELSATALEVVETLRPLFAGPLIALSASGSVSVAVEAVRRGADDFLVKPVAIEALSRRLRARMSEAPAPRLLASDARDRSHPASVSNFIGNSPVMQAVYDQIDRIAGSRAPVFITGESGTGKDLAAQALHERSPAGAGRFVALNCGAIPKDLMESEIFGHQRGAFTGATEDRAGAAELADGGTLFLDEICEMDLGLQAKLLRLIQTGEVRRVGASAARSVQVRFVCATNRDPLREVEAGRFREDLYYRLHVLPLHMPPLRTRGEDVVQLARAFLMRFSAEEGRAFRSFDPLAEALIARYAWPGNVRQLQNVIRRMVVLHEGDRITADMLPQEVMGTDWSVAPRAAVPIEVVAATPSQPGAILPMWLHEQRAIEAALTAFGGNIAKAAAALEINPSTIYRKRQSWGQQRSAAE